VSEGIIGHLQLNWQACNTCKRYHEDTGCEIQTFDEADIRIELNGLEEVFCISYDEEEP